MELISRILLSIIKGLALLIGIAMLIGGGLCSVSIPFIGFSQGAMNSETWMLMLLLLLIDVAVALAGYFLVRWILAKKSS